LIAQQLIYEAFLHTTGSGSGLPSKENRILPRRSSQAGPPLASHNNDDDDDNDFLDTPTTLQVNKATLDIHQGQDSTPLPYAIEDPTTDMADSLQESEREDDEHMSEQGGMEESEVEQVIAKANAMHEGASATPSTIATTVSTWASSAHAFFAKRASATATATPTIASPLFASFGFGSSSARAALASKNNTIIPVGSCTSNTTPSPPPKISTTPGIGSHAMSLDSNNDSEHMPIATPSLATPSSKRKPANRSRGNGARAIAAKEPDNTLEIVVGEWRQSTSTPRNAVIARLDARGRLNFRIVARSMARKAVAGTTATAASYANIILAGEYASMTYTDLRTLLIQRLSRRRWKM
jgi:hypothetical protein